MVRQEWLNDGDTVCTEFMMKYFNNLINFVTEKNLKEDFNKWVKTHK